MRFCFAFGLFYVLSCTNNGVHKNQSAKTIDSLIHISSEILESDSVNVAKTLGLKALELSKKSSNKIGLSRAYSNLGLYYAKIGKYDSATYYLHQSLNIRKKLQNPRLLAFVYTDLAVQAGNLKQLKTEKRFLDSAKFYAQKFNDTAYLMQLVMQYAVYYVQNRQLDSAVTYFTHFKNLATQTKDSFQLISAYLNLGNAVSEKNNNALAEKYLDTGFAITSLLKDTNGLMDYALSIADIAISNNNLLKAENFVLFIDQGILSGFGDAELKNLLFYKKGIIAYKKGDYKISANEMDNFIKNNDSLISSRNASLIAEMEIKYKTFETEKSNINLQKQNTRKNWLLLFMAISLLFIAVFSFSYFKNLKQKQVIAKQNLQLKENEIFEMLKTQELNTFDAALKGQDQERNRIAQELHDRLGSILGITKLHFSALQTEMEKMQQTHFKTYNGIAEMLDQATDEVRKISHDLYGGSVINFGLEIAMHQIANAISETNMVKVTFISKNIPTNLSQDLQINIYRISQELLSNSLKYANASQIYIQLFVNSNSSLHFAYEDNGIGFNTNINNKPTGIGFKNLETRVRKFNGTYTFESSLGNGMSFMAEIPFN